MTLLDTATVAAAFGVKPATVRQWRRRGKLPRKNKRGPAEHTLSDVQRLHNTHRRGA